MAPNEEDRQRNFVLCVVVDLVLTTEGITLQLNLILILQILLQHEALKREVCEAIDDKNRAVHKYQQLRN